MSNTITTPTAISGLSGGQLGTLVGVPANTDGTGICVFFTWTPSAADSYFFSTRGDPTNFLTLIAVYTISGTPHTPVVIGDLTLVSYLPAAGNLPKGYGYEDGAFVGFAATAGTQYYIKVGSRTGLTGPFNLSWGRFFSETLGACGACNSTTDGVCTAGTITEPMTNSAVAYAVTSFGTPPAGFYVVKYCNGADYAAAGNYTVPGAVFFRSNLIANWIGNIDSSTPSLPVSLIAGQIFIAIGIGLPFYSGFWQCVTSVTYSDYFHFHGNYQTDGNCAIAPVNVFGNSNGGGGWPSYAEAVIGNLCSAFAYCHAGGDFSAVWPTTHDPLKGLPGPTYSLLYLDPLKMLTLSVNSISNSGYVNGVDATGGYKYSVTVKISNTNLLFGTPGLGPFDGAKMTIALLTANGVTSPSAAVVFSVGPLSSTTATFTFNSLNTNLLVGTFQYTDCNANTVSTTVYLTLAQALLSVVSPFLWGTTSNCSTGSLQPSKLAYTVKNNGVVPCDTMSAVITAPSNPTSYSFSTPGNATPCTDTFPTNSWSGSLVGTLNPAFGGTAAGTANYTIALKRVTTGAPTRPVLSIIVSAGSIAMPVVSSLTSGAIQ